MDMSVPTTDKKKRELEDEGVKERFYWRWDK